MTLTAPEHLRGRMKCGGPLIAERSEWIATQARAGYSIRQISASIGINPGCIRDVLARMSVTARGKPGAPSVRPARIEAVAAFIAENPDCRASQIMLALGLSESAVSDAFQTLKATGRIHASTRYTYRDGPAPERQNSPPRHVQPSRDVRHAIVFVGETSTVNEQRPVKVSLPREPWSDGTPVPVTRRPMEGRTIRSQEDWRGADRMLRSAEKGAWR